MFALFHLPNPFLTAVTLVAGILAGMLYRVVPNLWAIGAGHGANCVRVTKPKCFLHLSGSCH